MCEGEGEHDSMRVMVRVGTEGREIIYNILNDDIHFVYVPYYRFC